MKGFLVSVAAGAVTGFLMVNVFGAPFWTACLVCVLLGLLIGFIEDSL